MAHADIGLIQFPGSNCDADCLHVFRTYYGIALRRIWHDERSLGSVRGVIIPGGFSFGDYLRTGALAAHSPIMDEVRKFAQSGGSIVGVCNGFQVLTEAGLLPGALLRNIRRKFLCQPVHMAFAANCVAKEYVQPRAAHPVVSMPIAHGAGRFFAAPDDLKRMEGEGQVVLRYVNESGDLGVPGDPLCNPNGSAGSIAGLVSTNGRVLGMMPHPERACDPILSSGIDGRLIWDAFLRTCG